MGTEDIGRDIPSVRRSIVIAPPGCGKTREIVQTVVNELGMRKGDPDSVPGPGYPSGSESPYDEGGVSPSILCVTLTNQATDEMLDRIRRMAPRGATLPEVSTLHSLCMRILRTLDARSPLNGDCFIVDNMRVLSDAIGEAIGLDGLLASLREQGIKPPFTLSSLARASRERRVAALGAGMPDIPDAEALMRLSCRGSEVKRWLEDHPDVTGYAILDDLPDFLPGQEPHLVLTDPRTGITAEVAERVTAILDGTGKERG